MVLSLPHHADDLLRFLRFTLSEPDYRTMVALLDDDLRAIEDTQAAPAGQTAIRNSAAESISNAGTYSWTGGGNPVADGFTAITFDIEDHDDLGAADLASNNLDVTVQEAGLYLIIAYVGWASNATGQRVTILSQNDVTIINAEQSNAVGGGNSTNQTLVQTVHAVPGDFFGIWVAQTSGGSLNVLQGCRLSLTRLTGS